MHTMDCILQQFHGHIKLVVYLYISLLVQFHGRHLLHANFHEHIVLYWGNDTHVTKFGCFDAVVQYMLILHGHVLFNV